MASGTSACANVDMSVDGCTVVGGAALTEDGVGSAEGKGRFLPASAGNVDDILRRCALLARVRLSYGTA